MWCSDLEDLIETHRNSVVKAVEAHNGVSLANLPVNLVEGLRMRYRDADRVGVCYNDIVELRVIPELKSITQSLNPNNYSMDNTFMGVNEYKKALALGIAILEGR